MGKTELVRRAVRYHVSAIGLLADPPHLAENEHVGAHPLNSSRPSENSTAPNYLNVEG